MGAGESMVIKTVIVWSVRISLILFMLGMSCVLLSCIGDETFHRQRILFDFESDSDLDRLNWHCGSMYYLSRQYQSSGSCSLKVEMYPSAEWPGFGFGVKDGWAGFRRISLTIFNPQGHDINMTCRIDDSRRNPPYADRVNRRILLKPGTNFVTLDLKALRTSGTGRPLRLDEVCCFLMFMHRPHEKTTVYVDDIVLD